MIGEDFIFNQYSLSDFGMKLYDPENSQEFISREIEKSDMTSIRQVPNHYSTHYTGTLVLSFLIIRDEDYFNTKNDLKLCGEDISLICAWLESPKTPEQLLVISGFLQLGLELMEQIEYNSNTRFDSMSKGRAV